MARFKSGRLSMKNSPTGEWLKNAGRSIGSLSSSMISNMMPATFDTASSASYDIQEMRNFARDFKASEKSLFGTLKEMTGFDEIQRGLDNIKEDLKSGNFNNNTRGDFGFDFDFEEDFNLDIDFDDEEIGNDEKAAIMTTKATIETSKATLNALNNQTASISNAVLAGSKANYNLGTATLKAISTGTSQITAGIAAMNDNLSMLVKFNGENMSNFVNVSMQYYNDSIDILKKILESQQSMENRQQAPPHDEIKQLKEDLLSGTFRIQDFLKVVKANRSNTAGSTGLGMIASMLDKTTIRQIADNPLGFFLPMMLQSMMPRKISKSLGSFDNMFKQFMPGMMMKVNGWKNSHNPLLVMLGNMLGINIERKTSANLSKFGNGPIPFDGETKKAILEQSVYLRKICAAVTGQDEFMLDRTTNKFESMSKIKEDHQTRMRLSQTTAFTDIMTDIRDTMSDIKFSSFKQQEEFMKRVENFFLTASKKDGLIKNHNKNMDFGVNTIDDILEESGMDYDSQRLFKAIWRKIPKGKKANALVSDVIDSRRGLNRFFDDLEQGNIFTAMNLDSKITGHAGVTSKFKGIGGVDKYGKGTLDYLHDIETLLIKGIKVIPTITGGEEPGHLKEMLDRMNTTKYVDSSPSFYNGQVSSNYTEAELNKMKANGEIGLNDLADLYRYSDEDLDKMLNYKSEAEKKSIMSKILPKKLYEKSQRGAGKVASGIDKVTTGMYHVLFGKPDSGDEAPTNIIESFDKNIKRFFASTGEWIGDHILSPMRNSLFGEKGLFTQIQNSQFYGKAKAGLKKGSDYLLGTKDSNGNRHGGLFSGIFGELNDIGRNIGSFFTGRGFTNSKGEYVKPEGGSVFGEIKNTFSTVGSAIKEKYIGKGAKEKGKGIITGAMDSLYEGIMDYKQAFTGKKIDPSKIKDEFQDDMKSIKAKLPKSLAWGTIGGAAAMFSGGTSVLGTLGGMFLPGGLIGGALIGSGLGMISQSESLKKLIFGPKDENGDRIGGLISDKFSKFFKENKNALIAGAGVGAIKSMIFGNGLLASFFLPGGPVGGALMGMGTSLAYKSKVVQDFLFGEMGEDGKRHNTGFLNKLTSKFKSESDKEGKKSGIKLGTVGAGMIGGAALSGIVGQFGLLGGMMTLGGSPLLGAMLGAASGIAMSSEKWRKSMFGEEVDGERKGGKLTKFGNLFKTEVAGAMREKIDKYKFNFNEWFIKGVSIPLNNMLDPVTTEFKYLFGKGKEKGKAASKFITGMFKETVGDPIVHSFDKFVIKPMGKLTSKLLGGTFKILGAIASSPFKLGGYLGDRISEKQERRGLKHYRAGINQRRKNGEIGFIDAFKAKYFDEDAIEAAKIGEFGASYKKMSAKKARKMGRSGYSNQSYQEKALARLAEQKEAMKKRQEQSKLRREYAKQLGYDNFKGDKNMAWIYGKDVEFSKDAKGNIIANKLGGVVTKTDTNVSTIKDATMTIASKITEIAKTVAPPHSSVTTHATTGKDSKSETKKTSAKGLTEIIDKEQKEKDQKEKVKYVSRKNVSFLTQQSIEKAKAKEEKDYKSKLLTKITEMSKDVKEQKTTWGSMFGKKGLLTMLMVGGFFALGKLPSLLSNLGLIGEKTEENLKDTTTNAQAHIAKNALTHTGIGKITLKAVDKFAIKKLTKFTTGGAAKAVGKEVAEQTAESVMREAMEGGVKAGVGEAVEKGVKEGQQTVVKKFIEAFGDKFAKGLYKVAESKFGKYLGKETVEKIAKETTEIVAKNLAGDLAPHLVKKLTKGMAKAGLKVLTTIGTAGIIDIGFAAYDGVTGWMNPGNLFGIRDEDADNYMKATSAIVKMLMGFSFIGPLVDVATEVIAAITSINLKRMIASFIYKGVVGEEKAKELDENAARMNEEYAQACKEGFAGTYDDYVKEQNKSWFGKAIDNVKGTVSKFFGGKDKNQVAEQPASSASSLKGTSTYSGPSLSQTVRDTVGYSNPMTGNSSSVVANNKSGGTYSGVTTSGNSGRPGMGYGYGPSGSTTKLAGSSNKLDFSESVNFILSNMTLPESKVKKMKPTLANLQKAFLSIPEKMDYSLGRLFNILDEEGQPMKVTDATTENFMKTNKNIAGIVDKSLDFFTKAKSTISSVLSRQKNNLNKYEPALSNMMNNITGITAGNAMATATGLSTGNTPSSSSSGGVWNTVKNVANSAWNGVKSVGSSIWNGVKSVGSTVAGWLGFGYGPEEGNDNFTYYSQNDPRWANNYYGSINGKDTNRQDMATRGCAPTAMAMVASELTGKSITPDAVANYSYNNGFSVKGGTDYNMIPSLSRDLGLRARDISQEGRLKAALSSNKPVIATGQSPVNTPSSPFTTGGHYVVMTGMKDGKVHVKDPLSPQRNGYYDLRTIAAQTGKAYALDRGNNRPVMGNSGDSEYSINHGEYGKYNGYGINLFGFGPTQVTADGGGSTVKSVSGPTGMDLVNSAAKLLGKPYTWGGNYPPLGKSPGTDCSGLCQWAYNDNGIKISRTTYTQCKEGREIKNRADLLPGDLVLCRWDGAWQHVVMVATPGAQGEKGIIEAQKKGVPIKYGPWRWDNQKWMGRRILDDAAAASGASASGFNPSTGSSSSSSTPSKPNSPLSMFSQVFSNMFNEVITGQKTELDWGNNPSAGASSDGSGKVVAPSGNGNTQYTDLPVGKPKEFGAFLAPSAQLLYRNSNILPSVTLAQAAWETGWGKHTIGNNLFGVKAGSGWTGKVKNVKTFEYDSRGRKYSTTAAFRDYDSIEDGMVDRGKLLSTSRYTKVKNATSYQEAARELYKAGYATDPQYPNHIIGVIKSNGFDKYDTKGNGFGFGVDIPRNSQADSSAGRMINTDISSQNRSRASTIARQMVSVSNTSTNLGLLTGILQALGTLVGYSSIIADNTGAISASTSNIIANTTNNYNSNPVVVNNNGGNQVVQQQASQEVSNQRKRAELISKGVF